MEELFVLIGELVATEIESVKGITYLDKSLGCMFYIVVHEKQKSDSGKRTQAVEIIYNCVGVIPDFAQSEAA